jgi:hypothetical protein
MLEFFLVPSLFLSLPEILLQFFIGKKFGQEFHKFPLIFVIAAFTMFVRVFVGFMSYGAIGNITGSANPGVFTMLVELILALVAGGLFEYYALKKFSLVSGPPNLHKVILIKSVCISLFYFGILMLIVMGCQQNPDGCH